MLKGNGVNHRLLNTRAEYRRRAGILKLVVALAALLLFVPAPVLVAGTRAQSGAHNLDVVLVIDNSGSMASNDPDGLRWSAAQLFVDLADSGDRIAALTFSAEVQLLGESREGDLTRIDDDGSRDRLKSTLGRREPEGATNMDAALRAAEELLSDNAVGNRQIIVFLTDGWPEPESQRPGLTEIIRTMGNNGVQVFPILLGNDVATDVADQMVRDTGSLRQDVASAAGLLRAFGQVFSFVQPDRYVDELSLTSSTTLSFQTNSEQAITEAVIIIPREDDDKTALKDLTLDGQDALKGKSLSNGARVGKAEAPHYQLARMSHNAPLAGEWQLGLGETAGIGLLIVKSQVTLNLIYPVSSVTDSFVAPRVVPAGKPVLLAAQLLRAGSQVGDAQVSEIMGGQSLLLDSQGLSANRSVYWKFVSLGPKGGLLPLELQVGQELTPFRLRKTFVLEPADVPPLVIDSPTATDTGLRAGGVLRLAAHFEGTGVSGAAVKAFVWDQAGDEVVEVDLTCLDQACQDESLAVEPGRAYQVVLVGEAVYEGRPFSDAGLTTFSTGDVIRVDGLEQARDLGTLTPGDSLPSVDLTITAFTLTGQPALRVSLENLVPRPAEADVSADLSPLTPAGGNTYQTQLTLRRLLTLPAGHYTVDVVFEAGDVPVVPEMTTISFDIPENVIQVDGLEALRDLGMLTPETGLPSVPLTISAFGLEGQPSLTIHLENLVPRPPEVDISADLSPLTETGDNTYQTELTLRRLSSLPPGQYTVDIVLDAEDADVAPDAVIISFEVPRSMFQLTGISPAREPVSCPPLIPQSRPLNLVDFGALYGKTAQVDLLLRGVQIVGAQDLRVRLASLHEVGKPRTATMPVGLRAAALQTESSGMYRLPLLLELPTELPRGHYAGSFELSSSPAATEPASFDLLFYKPGFLGKVVQRLRPVRCFAKEWYSVAPPFPRFKGLVGWIGTLFLLLLVIGTFRQIAQVDGGAGMEVRCDSDGSSMRLARGQPVYVVLGDGGQLRLSRRRHDAGRAVAALWPGQRDTRGRERANLQYGNQSPGIRLYYYSPRYHKWRRVHPKGMALPVLARFRVRQAGRRDDFTLGV